MVIDGLNHHDVVLLLLSADHVVGKAVRYVCCALKISESSTDNVDVEQPYAFQLVTPELTDVHVFDADAHAEVKFFLLVP